MIKQKVDVRLSNVIAEFNNADIAVGMRKLDADKKVAVTMSNIVAEKNIGDTVKQDEMGNTPIVMLFENSKSAEVVYNIMGKAIEALKEIEKAEAEKNLPRFTVPVKKIMVTSAFRNTTPNTEKVMSCQKYYFENGKLDKEIEVNSALVLKDGYVRYLVASYNDMENVNVVAPKGITIKVGNTPINFTSNKIKLSYHMIDGAFCLTIVNGENTYNIPAVDNVQAVEYVKKIVSVFDADITISSCSTLNAGLMERLKENNIKFSFK